jgi:predicted O-methyltransferase YrrM
MQTPSVSSLLHTKTGKALLLCALLAVVLAFVAALVAWLNLALALMFIALSIIFIVGLLILLYHRLVIQIGLHLDAGNWITFQQNAALQQLLNIITPRFPLPPMRMGAASPDVLLLLSQIILTRQPQTILECGAGISTLIQGYLLQRLGRGKLYTLEHNPLWAERVTRWVTEHQLTDYVTIIYAPLADQIVDGRTLHWYDAKQVQSLLETLSPIDFLFVDGPPGEVEDTRWPAVPVLHAALAPDAEIILDDTERPNERRAANDWAKQLDYDLEFIDNEKGAAWLQPRVTKRPHAVADTGI